jgi:hypothetical protein
MATHTPEPILGLPAAAVLAACTFVSENSSGQWAQTAAGAIPDGILPAKAEAVGDFCRAWLGPMGARYKAVCGGTIAKGANVAVGANGKLVAATTGAAIIGKMVDAAVANDVASFIWTGYRGVVP